MALLVIPLNKTHAVAAFDCGEPVLNQWLQTIAMQHQKNGASRTFALIDDAAPTVVLGFFTMAIRNFISSNELPVDLRKRLPRLVSGYTLARLGVAKSEKGRGYGALLLLEAMNRVCRAGKNVGGFALFVDAKEGAISFYEHFGFRPMVNDRKVLVLPIASMPNFPDEI